LTANSELRPRRDKPSCRLAKDEIRALAPGLAATRIVTLDDADTVAQQPMFARVQARGFLEGRAGDQKIVGDGDKPHQPLSRPIPLLDPKGVIAPWHGQLRIRELPQ